MSLLILYVINRPVHFLDEVKYHSTKVDVD